MADKIDRKFQMPVCLMRDIMNRLARTNINHYGVLSACKDIEYEVERHHQAVSKEDARRNSTGAE